MNGETELVRIARIGDSVFAVTLTLLAYRVRIPSHDEFISGKLAPLIPFLLDLWAVVLSFLVVSMFWISHWRVFRRMKHSDLKFVALNLAFLGTLTLLPISTSILSSNYGTRFGSLAFSASLFATATAGLFLRMHARRLDPQALGRGHPLLPPALAMFVFGIAMIVSLQWPLAASALWWIALLTPIVESRWGIGREV
jgi:uncharacterized membrane protein